MRKTCTYASMADLPLSLCASDIAEVLSISRSKAYELLNSTGFPTISIGRRMVVPRDKFLAWIDAQAGGDSSDS